MNKKQKVSETKYRLALLAIDELLKNNLITKNEFEELNKKLLELLKPVIGSLEVIE